jgi:hypothetical protein
MEVEGGLTIWVDDWEDVKVVFVEEGLDGGVIVVAGQELVGDVLEDLQRNESWDGTKHG